MNRFKIVRIDNEVLRSLDIVDELLQQVWDEKTFKALSVIEDLLRCFGTPTDVRVQAMCRVDDVSLINDQAMFRLSSDTFPIVPDNAAIPDSCPPITRKDFAIYLQAMLHRESNKRIDQKFDDANSLLASRQWTEESK